MELRKAHFPGSAPIDAYGNGGFRFADMSHRGSLLFLPSGIHGWDAQEDSPLTVDLFTPILDEEPGKIEVLLIGTGREMRFIPQDVRSALREKGIVCDPMNTGAAVRTYNILLAESRAVASALIAI